VFPAVISQLVCSKFKCLEYISFLEENQLKVSCIKFPKKSNLIRNNLQEDEHRFSVYERKWSVSMISG